MLLDGLWKKKDYPKRRRSVSLKSFAPKVRQSDGAPTKYHPLFPSRSGAVFRLFVKYHPLFPGNRFPY